MARCFGSARSKSPRPRKTVKRRPIIVAAVSIAAAAVIFAISKTILIPVVVDGVSMEPTLRDGSIHLVNTLAYRSAPPARGDIVMATIEGEDLIKRIRALPGETIILAEDGPLARARTLAADEYFLAGDHEDAHSYRVQRSQILGKLAW